MSILSWDRRINIIVRASAGCLYRRMLWFLSAAAVLRQVIETAKHKMQKRVAKEKNWLQCLWSSNSSHRIGWKSLTSSKCNSPHLFLTTPYFKSSGYNLQKKNLNSKTNNNFHVAYKSILLLKCGMLTTCITGWDIGSGKLLMGEWELQKNTI